MKVSSMTKKTLRFRRELYSRVALLKAAYNFTDKAYLHLDSDEEYYYVDIILKDEEENVSISENDFINEMLAQAVRHEVFLQTKDIRELLLARAMATSIVEEKAYSSEEQSKDSYIEDEILKDWFDDNETINPK